MNIGGLCTCPIVFQLGLVTFFCLFCLPIRRPQHRRLLPKRLMGQWTVGRREDLSWLALLRIAPSCSSVLRRSSRSTLGQSPNRLIQDRLNHIHLGKGSSRNDALANLVRIVEENPGITPPSVDITAGHRLRRQPQHRLSLE